ncbi:hypothetical protein CBR_g8078 [Chara braunii]|uniref:Uncharacterized protein n=1 Tax=Chara braunii TaxID=69332 RepID=A0A388KL53_CHABU|nr:hypothetical protein CBR_g8078 [Chara braunii]|eukprot:GBG70780.1 hypothetical protein CBR_g8078 [Chara braunii]
MKNCTGATCARGQKDVQLVPELEWTLFDDSEKADSDGTFISIDVHPHQPWVLCRPKENYLEVWNYEDGTRVTSWMLPSLHDFIAAKFIAQKNWIATWRCERACVYETQASNLHCIKALEHPGSGYLWEIAAHPTLPYILVSAAKFVVLWNWQKNWDKVTFEGHADRVQALTFHPTDSNIFASASGDGTIKVWDIRNRWCVQTLRGYCDTAKIFKLDFCSRPEKPLILSCNDTGLLIDYETLVLWDVKKEVALGKLRMDDFQGLGTDFFHPHLPYILGVSGDDLIRVWDESNHRLVASYDGGLGFRVECVAPCRNSNSVIAFSGKKFVVLKIATKGRNEESKAKMQMASFSAKRPRMNTPNDSVDEPGTCVSKKKRVVEMEDKAGYGKPEVEERILQAVASLELKWMEAMNEVREEHAGKIQKMEDDLEVKRMKAENEMKEEHAERLRKLEHDLELKHMKAVKELREEHA